MKYVIEHLEETLGEWSRCEYLHLCNLIPPENLIFTLFPKTEILDLCGTNRRVLLDSLESVKDLKSLYELPTVCLLDMKADQALSPNDAKFFNTFIFGGILGNCPAEDRTSQIRCVGASQRRHLGTHQMTTDTAVLVTKLIVEDGLSLETIPYVDDPELHINAKESVELPFRYISKSFFTHDSQDRFQPFLPEGLIHLLQKD